LINIKLSAYLFSTAFFTTTSPELNHELLLLAKEGELKVVVILLYFQERGNQGVSLEKTIT